MRGRRPKPTALKVLQGNPGKRKLPEAEPQPSGVAEKPPWLRKKAALIWDEYAPDLIELGLLTAVDGEQFAQWCALAARFRSEQARMPASLIARMESMASKFGLDPSSRARLGGAKPKQPANPFDDLSATG